MRWCGTSGRANACRVSRVTRRTSTPSASTPTGTRLPPDPTTHRCENGQSVPTLNECALSLSFSAAFTICVRTVKFVCTRRSPSCSRWVHPPVPFPPSSPSPPTGKRRGLLRQRYFSLIFAFRHESLERSNPQGAFCSPAMATTGWASGTP